MSSTDTLGCRFAYHLFCTNSIGGSLKRAFQKNFGTDENSRAEVT